MKVEIKQEHEHIHFLPRGPVMKMLRDKHDESMASLYTEPCTILTHKTIVVLCSDDHEIFCVMTTEKETKAHSTYFDDANGLGANHWAVFDDGGKKLLYIDGDTVEQRASEDWEKTIAEAHLQNEGDEVKVVVMEMF